MSLRREDAQQRRQYEFGVYICIVKSEGCGKRIRRVLCPGRIVENEKKGRKPLPSKHLRRNSGTRGIKTLDLFGRDK